MSLGICVSSRITRLRNNQTKSKKKPRFPEKKRKRDKNAVASVKIVSQLGCVSQDSDASQRGKTVPGKLYSSAEEWVLPGALSQEPEGREFVADSGASMHMVSNKNLNSAELETMRMSKNLTTLMTANGEEQIREEVTVSVKELDFLVMEMLLEETPSVFLLGKLCEDGHGRLWPNRLWPNRRQFQCFKVLTDFGQTDFGQFECFSVLAKFSEPKKPKPQRPKNQHLDMNPKPYRPQ